MVDIPIIDQYTVKILLQVSILIVVLSVPAHSIDYSFWLLSGGDPKYKIVYDKYTRETIDDSIAYAYIGIVIMVSLTLYFFAGKFFIVGVVYFIEEVGFRIFLTHIGDTPNSFGTNVKKGVLDGVISAHIITNALFMIHLTHKIL